MHWLIWAAAYMLIIAGAVFIIIPEKPWWLWLAIIILGYTGYCIIKGPPFKLKKNNTDKGESI